MTSHHQFQKFARLVPPGAAAIGRGLVVPPLGAPTTFNYRQHGSTHERGRGVPYELGVNLVCRASIPADGRRATQFRLSVTFVSLTHLARAMPLVLFGAEGHGANRVLTSIKTRRRGHFQCFAQRHPSHSKSPSRYAVEASAGGLRSVPERAGEFPKGQGERHHVSCV